jgi:type IV pilus assembly protein PilV
MNPQRTWIRGRAQRGVTIIEVLVAVVVLSLGMIGILGANTKGFANVNSAGHRAQATWLAGQIIERARANTSGSYTVDFGSTTAGNNAQATKDISTWKAILGRTIPMGDAQITEVLAVDPVTNFNTRRLQVVVRWDDRRASTEGAANASDPVYRHFLTESYLPAPL